MNIFKKIKIFFLYYLPLIFWLSIIFYFSSIPDLKSGVASISGEILIRKGAHFLEYFILAWLCWRIIFDFKKFNIRISFFLSLLFSFIYAVTDEYHQSFVIGRSGKTIDVLFDFFSALFFLQCMVFFKAEKERIKKIIWAFLILIILIGIGIKMERDAKTAAIVKNKIIQEEKIPEIPIKNDLKDNVEKENIIQKEEKIPEKFLVDVPFTTQAPFAKWDEYHEEACEEASLIMLKYFFDKKELTPETAEKEIQNLIKFQIKNYKNYKDSPALEIVRLAIGYYEIKNLKVVYDLSKEDLKKYLAKGKPIIIPAAGRLLKNPNFKSPGPLYHNLVLIGYDGNSIITNDPGTRKGKGYIYSIDTIFNAIHDFTGKKEEIEKGRKAMIIIE